MAPPPGGIRTALSNLVGRLTGTGTSADKRSTPPPMLPGAPMPTYTFGAQNLSGGIDITQFSNTFQPNGPGNTVFSPGYPLVPTQPERVRTWDFPVGYNYSYTPRSYEPVSFADLEALANNHDLTRLCIETRKDQIEGLEWQIRPRDAENPSADAEKRAEALTEFWRVPNGHQPFASWLREALENVLVYDAPAFEILRNRRGDIIGLDVVDGATIKLLIDDTGRRPQSPAPAYQQVIHGRPWVLLTADDLLYMPRNPRPGHNYGYGPVEQVLTTVNIGIRRQTMQLQHFTEGNVPAGIINGPEGWNPDQTKQFQEWFDSILAGNTAMKTRVLFTPAGAKFQAFKEAPYKDMFDEWLARVVCYAFSLPPNAFVERVNRATAQTAQETALQEGLGPLMGWVKRFIDHVIQRHLGHDDVEFAWSEKKELDPVEESKILVSYVKDCIFTPNEARDALGFDAIEGGDELVYLSGATPITLERIINPPEPPPMLAGVPPSAGGAGPGGAAQGGQKKPAANSAAKIDGGRFAEFDKARKAATISQEAADYVHHPIDGKKCADCSMFRAPDSCTLVTGDISAEGHCKFWEAAATDKASLPFRQARAAAHRQARTAAHRAAAQYGATATGRAAVDREALGLISRARASRRAADREAPRTP